MIVEPLSAGAVQVAVVALAVGLVMAAGAWAVGVAVDEADQAPLPRVFWALTWT